MRKVEMSVGKQRIAIIMLILGVLVMFFSCRSNKELPKAPEQRPEPQELKKLSLVPWENKPAIKDDSKMAFYTEFEINIVGSIPDYIYQTNDGDVEKINKSQNFDYQILKETPGSLIENGIVRNSSGLLKAIKVSYFEENDCYIIFSIEKGNSYYFLENKAVVVWNGKEYQVSLSIVGNGGGRCRVFYNENEVDESTTIKKVATGKIIPGIQKLP